jgi:hypothetical protein
MKIEQNVLTFAESADPTGTNVTTGYIDLPRVLSAVNGKSIAQTKRHDGKYKPLGYMVRVRALTGTITVESLNCGYPTRNSVVLAGAARDAMLKSAGISRSNLESYQKELRILMDGTMTAASNQYFPGATAVGSGSGGWGVGFDYDYTKLVINRPDDAADGITKALAMLGTQDANEDNWDSDAKFYVVDNWLKFRHSFTPSATADDIDNNVFSWAMQQGETAGDIIDMQDDNADEKPYNLSDFTTDTMLTTVSTAVGSPTSHVICAPLGLLKIRSADPCAWEIEVVGVTEL